MPAGWDVSFYARRWGVHVEACRTAGELETCSGQASARRLLGLLAWHAANVVPVLDITDSLESQRPARSDHAAVGAAILLVRLWVAVGILAVLKRLWDKWGPGSQEDRNRPLTSVGVAVWYFRTPEWRLSRHGNGWAVSVGGCRRPFATIQWTPATNDPPVNCSRWNANRRGAWVAHGGGPLARHFVTAPAPRTADAVTDADLAGSPPTARTHLARGGFSRRAGHRGRVRSCPPSWGCHRRARSAGTRCLSDWRPAVRGV
jgi:hypothetical protein